MEMSRQDVLLVSIWPRRCPYALAVDPQFPRTVTSRAVLVDEQQRVEYAALDKSKRDDVARFTDGSLSAASARRCVFSAVSHAYQMCGRWSSTAMAMALGISRLPPRSQPTMIAIK